MLYAKVNGEKSEATPNLAGECQLCDQPVFSRCGEINVWHWAHHKNESCDSWYEPETNWHRNWKFIFGEDYREIIISKDGIKHIADIQTRENVIIELQNSTIQAPIIREREIFYGEQMIWIINGKHFKSNFDIKPPRSASLDEDEEYWQLHNPLANRFGALEKIIKGKRKYTWRWSRRSWTDVGRPVFIDFGDESLFWVLDGMGSSTGKGKQISKEQFVIKHGGNIETLATIIDNTSPFALSVPTLRRTK
jgi:hypothetical protein